MVFQMLCTNSLANVSVDLNVLGSLNACPFAAPGLRSVGRQRWKQASRFVSGQWKNWAPCAM